MDSDKRADVTLSGIRFIVAAGLAAAIIAAAIFLL